MSRKENNSSNSCNTQKERDAVVDNDQYESNSYKEYWDYFMQTYHATPSGNTIMKNRHSKVINRGSSNRNKSTKKKKSKTQWATPPFNARIKPVSVSDETSNMFSSQIRSTSTSAGLTSSLTSSSHQIPRSESKKSEFNSDSNEISKSYIYESTHSPELASHFALDVERVLFTPERLEEMKQEEEYECVEKQQQEEKKLQQWEHLLKQSESDELEQYSNYIKSEQVIYEKENVLRALQLESLSKENGKYTAEKSSLFDKQVKEICSNSICYDKMDMIEKNLVCIELSSDDENDDEHLDRIERNVKQNETGNDNPAIVSNQETNHVYVNSNHEYEELYECRDAISQGLETYDANIMRPVKDNEESIFKVDPNITQCYAARLTPSEGCNREILEFLSWSEERHKVKLKAIRELQDNFLSLSTNNDESTKFHRNTQTTQNENSSIINNSIESCALQLRSAYANSHPAIIEQTPCAEKEEHLEMEAVQREGEEEEEEDVNVNIDKMTETTLPCVYIAEPESDNTSVNANKNSKSKMNWERAKLINNKIYSSSNSKKANVVSAKSKICHLPYYLHPSAPPSRFIH